MEDKVLETVINGVNYEMLKDVLVKPLEPVMVTKEITEQVPTGEVDENGYNLYETKTETKEVESDFGRGIVLKMPTITESEFNTGDIIIYNRRFAKYFDLFKDSQLVKPYDVIAVER